MAALFPSSGCFQSAKGNSEKAVQKSWLNVKYFQLKIIFMLKVHLLEHILILFNRGETVPPHQDLFVSVSSAEYMTHILVTILFRGP